MFLAAESANANRPSIGFCNEFPIGAKYAGFGADVTRVYTSVYKG